jgi:hypothetical protein
VRAKSALLFLMLAAACGPSAPNGEEDLDGDGKADSLTSDADKDGIPDGMEGRKEEVDTDGDGTPDFLDLDSDGDGVKDAHERVADVDNDGVMAFRDLDSDGDCIPDAKEAGDTDLETPPPQTDNDGDSDLIDVDADGDGVLDQDEDVNCNGARDAGETDRRAADSDGDQVTDLVEQVAETDPNDPTDNPKAHGNFVFTVPYTKDPIPAKETLDFRTKITQADVVFMMDTTGSMGEELAQLKAGVQGIAQSLAVDIPNVGLGAAGYEDFADTGNCYGLKSDGDRPFYLVHRVASAGVESVKTEIGKMVVRNGRDYPESGWHAIHELTRGLGVSYNGVTVPAFNAATAFAPAGAGVGSIGGAGFRSGSLPIIVWVTDEISHNTDMYPQFNYGLNGCPAVSVSANRATAIDDAKAIGAKVIPVLSYGGQQTAAARADMHKIVFDTGTRVPPTAWDGPGRTCAAGTCCTGLSGAGEAPDNDGMCPLIFRLASNGSGLSDSVTKAIKVLTEYGVIDIGAQAADDPADTVDAVAAFVDKVKANVTSGGACATGIAISAEVFQDVKPGTVVCFDVTPRQNTSVEAKTTPQVFKATVSVVGDGVTKLDTRTVLFLVPPEFKHDIIE